MSEQPTDPIRVCLLVDGDTITEWQDAALQRMVDETSAQPTVVVKNRKEQNRSTWELVKRAIELREWTLVWLVRSLFAEPTPLSGSVPINDCEYISDCKVLECVPDTVEGWKHELTAETVEQVAEEADVGIRFGFGFLTGDILTELTHGVLSYHHGDFREYRGQPAGAWEYIHGRDEAGITLQRINEQLDAGEVAVMKRISIENARTHSEVRGLLYEHSEDMLATTISKVENGQTEFEKIDELGPLYTMPSGIPALRYLAKELRGFVQQRIS